MDFHQLAKVRKLYKAILKLHRGLPEHIKNIGDSYAREEFRRHIKCDPKLEAVFVEEWTKYAILLTQQLGLKGPKTASKIGRNLTRTQLDSMSDEQIQRIYEVMLATHENNDDSDNNVKEEIK